MHIYDLDSFLKSFIQNIKDNILKFIYKDNVKITIKKNLIGNKNIPVK